MEIDMFTIMGIIAFLFALIPGVFACLGRDIKWNGFPRFQKEYAKSYRRKLVVVSVCNLIVPICIAVSIIEIDTISNYVTSLISI